jgi:hypothetical protein
MTAGREARREATTSPEADVQDGVVAASECDRLPVQGFTGTPEEIERQWYEQVYRGRGDSSRRNSRSR